MLSPLPVILIYYTKIMGEQIYSFSEYFNEIRMNGGLSEDPGKSWGYGHRREPKGHLPQFSPRLTVSERQAITHVIKLDRGNLWTGQQRALFD